MTAEKIGLSLDKYGDEDLLSTLVRYGLFIGAICQFVFLASAVLMTGNNSEEEKESEVDNRTRNRITSEPEPTARRHKLRKLEKKKRR